MTIPDPALDAQRLRAAVEQAGNIPTLLSVLHQLTGEDRWVSEDYRPARTKGFEELNDGGLDPERQAVVREAAVAAVLAWHRGTPAAVPDPSDEVMARLMSTTMGERVDPAYAPLVAEQAGIRPYVPEDVSSRLADSGREFPVVVVGAGVSGLLAAIDLRRAGIPFTVLEKNSEVGGTWWENRYPGARVDIPSNLYSVSFAPHNWSEHFSRRDEISAYFADLADRFDVRRSIRFGVEVQSAEWDEAAQRWQVSTVDGSGTRATLHAAAVVTAVGLHNRPRIPELSGREDFAGEVFHSAQWPDGVDLAGKRVAVVGAGASAMQVVSAVVDEVAELTVLQRAPQWVAPNEYYFRPVPPDQHWLFDHVPYYRGWYRFRLYWLYTERLYPAQVVDPGWDRGRNSVNGLSDAFRKLFTGYLRMQLDGREDLVEKSLPDYPVLGKRLLLDNGWFAALRKPHVQLLTEGLAGYTPKGIVTSAGTEVEVDVVILCTGFHQQRFLAPLEITGREGRELRREWADEDGRAHLGITAPGFPNLFFLYGPNTNPPGGSWITIAEAQAKYVTETLVGMVRAGVGAVEVRQEPFEAYNRELDEANAQMVYGIDGVDNYYRNATGRVVTNAPWPVLRYWTMTAAPDPADFRTTPAAVPAAAE
ncbi:flavin-containing monooxygenase [Pseudonocardia pini]|uniref:flavin-containing monooxygenase n=1 Tax=Pseudonocardia pini TaxID=2758030 RepID=UPI001C68F2DA|nr:NAD(P)/FAD-dependent oxidoreductase [Pseudonocardia pini]